MDTIDSMFISKETTQPVVLPRPEVIEGLKSLQEFVDELRATSKSNTKREIISAWSGNEFVKKVVLYTSDPFRKYHTTSSNCLKNSTLIKPHNLKFFEMFDLLASRELSGYDGIASVNFIIELYSEWAELIYCIIDKNLKTRANATLINKVWGDFIPTFDVALAKPFELKRVNFDGEDWWCSRKLDGVRCLAIYTVKTNTVALYSRVGNTFTTLDKVAYDILKLDLQEDTVFDGEICMMDDKGNEDFQGIMKEIKRKDHTIANPKYIIFDMLSKGDFDRKKSKDIFSVRNDKLISVLKGRTDLKVIEILPQELLHSVEDLTCLVDRAKEMNYEGVMVRHDVPYEGKRTFNLMKVKKFHDAEFEVVGYGLNVHRILVEKDGDMVEEETTVLAQVEILYKGEVVEVGSGWKQWQRIHYAKHPEQIVGKVITVQWFEETTNKDGKISLRFPTMKWVHGEEREF